MVIKRFDPYSCAKVAGGLYAIIGLFAGAAFSLISVMGGLGSALPSSAAAGVLLGAGAIIVLPILYGLLGFVMTLIGAACYNGIAKFAGGIRIDVE